MSAYLAVYSNTKIKTISSELIYAQSLSNSSSFPPSFVEKIFLLCHMNELIIIVNLLVFFFLLSSFSAFFFFWPVTN